MSTVVYTHFSRRPRSVYYYGGASAEIVVFPGVRVPAHVIKKHLSQGGRITRPKPPRQKLRLVKQE